MATYCVNMNAQPNGDHEVHTNCDHLPEPANQKYLGVFNNCREAVSAAKAYYSQVNGCYYCCNACHTQ